ncbi:MAG: 2-hydroxychromene-2-carboxylate isomerase [Xanthomonadaceae bacterium]|jgi:2-hydroxychromene-2-carboxylate isomerase|nr:2-hydroxychromene-2-carboxylate isomerase [Xanthomonadaceae bacterium]
MGLRHADWYFDFISPFSWLQWRRLDALRDRLAIRPVPVVLGAMLARFENKGPAEIPAKRAFTYRFVHWQARRAAVALRFPPTHPFNPLPALRLAVALDARAEAIDAIFRAIWERGEAMDTPQALAPLAADFGITDVAAAIGAPAVKERLRADTEAAIAAGVFGVPTLAIDGLQFWGNDATPMLEDWLADPTLFEGPEFARLATLPASVSRA